MSSKTNRAPLALFGLGFGLLVLGFFIGYGFQSRSRAAQLVATSPTPQSSNQAPLVKGLHASPDGSLLAFTGIWDRFSRAGVWVIGLRSGKAHLTETPAGWQDTVTQWRNDGNALLLEREKIPRPAAAADGGLYQAPIDHASLASGDLVPLTPSLPLGEKVITGMWAPNGQLIVKTRSEPKHLWTVHDGAAIQLDAAQITYGQNRAVREGNQMVIYAVRDLPTDSSLVALYRVVGNKAQQISSGFKDVSWSYVSPNGHMLILARQADEGEWDWTLYRIEGQSIKKLKEATIPADVISVLWSPDEKRALGSGGHHLWTIDIPSLTVKQLGQRDDWRADAATWVGNKNQAVVASNGELWQVQIPTGTATKIWKFPDAYWN